MLAYSNLFKTQHILSPFNDEEIYFFRAQSNNFWLNKKQIFLEIFSVDKNTFTTEWLNGFKIKLHRIFIFDWLKHPQWYPQWKVPFLWANSNNFYTQFKLIYINFEFTRSHMHNTGKIEIACWVMYNLHVSKY